MKPMLIIIYLFLFIIATSAQLPAAEKTQELRSVHASISWFESEIQRLKSEYSSTSADKSSIEQDLRNLSDRKRKAELQFVELASGLEIQGNAEISELPKRNVFAELEDLISPILSGLRRISERPRNIERLRSELDYLERSYQSRKQASEKLLELSGQPSHESFKSTINRLRSGMENEIQGIQVEIDSRKRTLSLELGETKTVIEEISEMFKSFFASKGQHLIFAIIAFIISLAILRRIKTKLFAHLVKLEHLQIFLRPLHALYHFVAIALSFLVFIATLYLFHDWVLVTVSLLIMTGVLWSFKHLIPPLINEIKLILNLGTVREGERVMWNGLPWRVEKLGMTAILKNEYLTGGEVRLPAREMMSLISRRFATGETLFPTKCGDWVTVGDVHGEVIMQTPDEIQIRVKGGIKYFRAVDYYNSPIENLAQGYMITATFGLDYALQKIATTEVVQILNNKFREKIKAYPGIGDKVILAKAEFAAANESSLDYFFMVVCSGEIASESGKVKRLVQEIVVNICNEEGYEIPFPQRKIHISHAENQTVK